MREELHIPLKVFVTYEEAAALIHDNEATLRSSKDISVQEGIYRLALIAQGKAFEFEHEDSLRIIDEAISLANKHAIAAVLRLKLVKGIIYALSLMIEECY
jgi:hypothetical protein